MAGGLTGGAEAAQAIMTTDTVPKQVALHHDGNWTVGGMAKGAGMMAPSLATMLCVITTDAVADADALDRALRNAAARTFDRLDIDGSCSTNDTVLLLASGASEVTPTQDELDAAVLAVCDDLCAQLQADAEGVTKRVAVTVTGAASEADAVVAARVDRPRQPGQDGAVRLRPQLGPGARRGRHGARRHGPPTGSACRSTASPVCVDGAGAPGARDVDLSGADIAVVVDLGVGTGEAHDPHHRPVPRLRRRELGLLARDAPRAPDGQGRGARRGAAVAQATPRQDRRRQVRRQRHDRRRPQGGVRRGHGVPAQLRHPPRRRARRRPADQRHAQEARHRR